MKSGMLKNWIRKFGKKLKIWRVFQKFGTRYLLKTF